VICSSKYSLLIQLIIPQADPQLSKVNVTCNNKDVVKDSEVVWIATKPHVIPNVLREISSLAKPNQLFISVAAGTTIKTLEEVSPRNTIDLAAVIEVYVFFEIFLVSA